MPSYSLGSAAAQSLWRCRECDLLCKVAQPGAMACPRCHAPLYVRYPHSLQRCWAFLISAIICYIPANVLPIMESVTFKGVQQDTIISGVVYLWQKGSWGVAFIVFSASILVPLLKIMIMLLLLLTVQFHSRWRAQQRTRLFRMIERIGPWSMLDIYVLGLLVALVQWPAIAFVHAGWGALAFGAVIVFTMLAALSFDPRLIWDAAHE